MKKYIAPVAKYINISSEGMMAGSNDLLGNGTPNDEVGKDVEASNQRERFSIWGNEDLY